MNRYNAIKIRLNEYAGSEIKAQILDGIPNGIMEAPGTFMGDSGVIWIDRPSFPDSLLTWWDQFTIIGAGPELCLFISSSYAEEGDLPSVYEDIYIRRINSLQEDCRLFSPGLVKVNEMDV